MARGGLALAASGSHCADGDDGLRGLDLGVLGPEEGEGGAGGVHEGAEAHDVLVGDVGVGEHALVDLELLDELGEVGLGVDRDSLRVELAGEGGRVLAVVDVGDLRRGEGHDVVVLVVAEEGVEVVEVAPRGSDDDDVALGHVNLQLRRLSRGGGGDAIRDPRRF